MVCITSDHRRCVRFAYLHFSFEDVFFVDDCTYLLAVSVCMSVREKEPLESVGGSMRV